MFSYILLIIGFLLEGGTFGANLINGFEWVRIMYYGIAIILAFLYLFIFFMSYIVSKERSLSIKQKTTLIGIVGGSATYVIIMTIVWIVLVNTIINMISPEANNWSDLSSNTQFLIIFWFILTFVIWLKSKLTEDKEGEKETKSIEKVLNEKTSPEDIIEHKID